MREPLGRENIEVEYNRTISYSGNFFLAPASAEVGGDWRFLDRSKSFFPSFLEGGSLFCRKFFTPVLQRPQCIYFPSLGPKDRTRATEKKNKPRATLSMVMTIV